MAEPPRNIILVGFMASGKTSVGRALAYHIGWTLVDADDVIVARAGKPIHRIFAEDGEPAFRELESQVIAELCAAEQQVIASGGGAFVSERNRDVMLAGGRVFFLSSSRRHHPAAGARGGCTGGPIRPLLAVEDPEARIAELLAQRTPAYTQAHHDGGYGHADGGGGGGADSGDLRHNGYASGRLAMADAPANIAYRWAPIQPLNVIDCSYDFSEIDSLQRQWLSIKERREESDPQSYRAFLERLDRSSAIETGIIEGLYTLDRGVTETLVQRGFNAELIDRAATNKDPEELVWVLEDHRQAVEGVYHYIPRG